jgi:hypothetical protein
MPYSLTMDRETTPWFKEPTLFSWLSLIVSVPAACAALWSLLKVEESLEKISNVISVTNINGHIFGSKETRTDDQNEAETLIGKKVKIYLNSKPHKIDFGPETDPIKPIVGTLKSENFHTILIKTDENSNMVIFKHSIATIETTK